MGGCASILGERTHSSSEGTYTCILMHTLHCVAVRARRGDRVHWESSSGVGIDGGEVGRRRATACKPQTGWLRRGCTQSQSCLCQGNYPDVHPPLVELLAERVANTLAPPFIGRGKLPLNRPRWSFTFVSLILCQVLYCTYQRFSRSILVLMFLYAKHTLSNLTPLRLHEGFSSKSPRCCLSTLSW